MSEVESLILEHLRQLRAGQDILREDMREVKNRLGHLEEQYASISRRIDRIDQRLERRLDLVE